MSRIALYRWWRKSIVARVNHETVLARVVEESGWSPRFAFMTMMSAGIAVLGLLLSSPAVVIGAMLISPLMSPILGFGFSLALFDFGELRRPLKALAIGTGAAIAFTAFIVLVSTLQAPTAEIVARTRPNLFDLAVALFAALAGTFAIIRGLGDTIVGVAIATALMPPFAVVGYGIATRNVPVVMGAFALFATNFITIALAATVMARFYGFGHHLPRRQSWLQTIILTLVFVAMAVPLGISLNRIGREALATTQVRSLLNDRFGDDARITQLGIDFTAKPIEIRTVVITPRRSMQKTGAIEAALARQLARPVRLNLDQISLGAGADALAVQREELRQASDVTNSAGQRVTDIVNGIALITGVTPDAVTIDRDHRRAVAAAATLPGATVATYRARGSRRASERRLGRCDRAAAGYAPQIAFADGADTLDVVASDAVMTSGWAARRWNILALAVPGLPAGAPPTRPDLTQRRALAVAALLRRQGIAAEPAPPAGQRFTRTAPTAADPPSP